MEWFANVFAEATEAYGGVIARDNEIRGKRFLASTFRGIEKAITRNDAIQGGLALELSGREAKLYSYTLRLVCSNGLISTLSEEEEEFTWYRETEFEEAIYRKYAELETTASQVAGLYRESQQQRADERLWQHVLSSLNQLQADTRWMDFLFIAIGEEGRRRRFNRPENRHAGPETEISRFGLVNAVTAMARDTQEPELRWQMEKLGGELLLMAKEEKAAPVKKQHLEIA